MAIFRLIQYLEDTKNIAQYIPQVAYGLIPAISKEIFLVTKTFRMILEAM